MMIELMLSTAPMSKKIQDLASKFGVTQQRFKPRNEECVYCGLCVRMCDEQMDARAIGFQNRGYKRKISTPFDIKSEECRLCGACMYVCPACSAPLPGAERRHGHLQRLPADRADLPRGVRRAATAGCTTRAGAAPASRKNGRYEPKRRQGGHEHVLHEDSIGARRL